MSRKAIRRIVVALTFTVGLATALPHLHADDAYCSKCGCDPWVFSPNYHGSVCDPGPLFPELCFWGHACDNLA